MKRRRAAWTKPARKTKVFDPSMILPNNFAIRSDTQAESRQVKMLNESFAAHVAFIRFSFLSQRDTHITYMYTRTHTSLGLSHTRARVFFSFSASDSQSVPGFPKGVTKARLEEDVPPCRCNLQTTREP